MEGNKSLHVISVSNWRPLEYLHRCGTLMLVGFDFEQELLGRVDSK
jgi:hypothetical protein